MSRNISKEKRENLINKIKELKSFLEKQNATPEMRAYLSELESEIKRQKFGLVFEEHKEEIDEILETHTPVLTEDKNLFIDNGGNMNFLIEGDNLAALTLLEKTHKGKVDLIYIDPPYNTRKKDFKYADKFVDKNDLFGHSKWLSFIKSRLEIAKKLLKSSGIIFISIDDNEQAQLKMLCDSVFGYDCFIALLAIENNPKGRKNQQYVSGCNDYCLIYAIDKRYSSFIENIPKNKKDMALDENGVPIHNSGKRVLVGEGDFNNFVTDLNSRKHYSVYYNPELEDLVFIKENNIEEINKELIKDGYERYISFHNNEFIENTYTQDRLFELFEDGALDFKNNKIYEKNFANRIRIKSIVSSRDYQIYSEDGKIIDYKLDVKTTSAIQSLKLLFNTKRNIFDNPKNQGLLKLLLSLTKNTDSIILDFFAGSGTTGHAVLELNKEDGGNRKFILCTNNENNICRDITYERMKTVITGKRKDNSEYSKPIKASLKYQKIDFIPTAEKIYYDYADNLLKHIKELVELENAINFDGNTELEILLTEDDVERFFNNAAKLNQVKTIYLGHDVSLTLIQQSALSNNGVIVNIIPEYYYKEKQI